MEPEISEEFQQLHLFTIKFTKGNDSSAAKALSKIIKELDLDTLSFAKPFIFMEITKSLKEASKCDRKLELLDIAKLILDKTPGGAVQQSGLFNTLSDILISSNPRLTSEELFKAALDCLITISKKCPAETKRCMYIKMNAPFLGKSIFAVTQLARKHECAELKFMSMKFILSICSLEKLDFVETEKEREFREGVSEVLMFFLPGIVSACQEVALDNVKKQHRITVIALRVWGRIIALVMEDAKNIKKPIPTASDFLNLLKNDQNSENIKNTKELPKTGKADILQYLSDSKRSSKWMQEASSKIATLFPHLTPIITHEHPNVRLELVNCCQLILEHAWNNCGVCKSDLLVILFILSRDEVPNIAKTSELALKSIISSQGVEVVVRIIENTLHKRVSNMPNLINTIDERALMSSLDFLVGVLKVLGEFAKEIFTTQTQERIIDVLTIVVQIDVASVSLDETSPEFFFSLLDNLKHFHVKKLPPFRHICDSDKEILEKIELLCTYLGSTNGPYLIDILFSRIEQGMNTLESVILTTYILRNSGKEHLEICNNMLQYWQYDNIWYLPTKVKPEKPRGPNYKSRYFSDYTPGLYEGSLEVRYTDLSTTTIEDKEEEVDSEFCKNLHEVKYNTMLIALQCEAIGSLAVAMGSDFRRFFLKYLYLIIERCGHHRQCVQSSALIAATDFQKYSNVNTLSELIDINADYLVNSISIKLNHIINYNAPDTGILDALVIVLENCRNQKHLSSFADVIKKVEEMHFKCPDFITCLLRVYRAFVKQLVLLYGMDSKIPKEEASGDSKSLLTSIKELQEAIDIENEMLQEPVENEESNEDAMDTENAEEPDGDELMAPELMEDNAEQKPPPEHVSLASEILKRSIPFISSDNDTHRLYALDVVSAGIPLMAEHEDTLLPALHETWNPVATRLRGSTEAQLKVLRRAFAVACSLSALGKDFLRQRAIGSVLAEALKFLKAHATETKSKMDSPEAYRHTQLFKLQYEVLSGLGDLSLNLQFEEKTRHEVMAALYKYLHDDSKPELREAAQNSFVRLADENVGDVAYFLGQIWPLEILEFEVESSYLEGYKNSVLTIDKMIAAKR